MKISLNWIKEYVDLPEAVTPEKLAYDLTMSTVEVEEVIDQGRNFDKMVVGKVIELKEHPNADKLRLAITDVGSDECRQIVCGGTNLFEGMLVVVALPGAKVKWHGQGDLVELNPTKIRGQESFGMICASEEVGLKDILPGGDKEIMNISFTNSLPGTPIAKVFELDDVIFDIDNKSLTNRPDLWGHYGLAREIAALYQVDLQPLSDKKIEIRSKEKIKVRIKSDACFRYLGTVVDNVKVAPSPPWLKKRLQAVGQKSINNIVDLTNYVMYETGQPTHAFDYAKLAGSQIIARQANQDEPIITLDKEENKMTDDILVIADAKQAVAMAGVIGGQHSAISDNTTKVVFEAAAFDPISVRLTSQRLGVRTESSIRFEKGIDTDRAQAAMQRILQLVVKLLPEAKIGPLVDETKESTVPIKVKVDTEFINSRLGKELTVEEITKLLTSLQFNVKVKGGGLQVEVPVWRATGDVSLPEDIVEEVARMYGYNNLDFYPPTVQLVKAVRQPKFQLERKLKEYLALAAGMNEVFNYPWAEQRIIDILGWDNEKSLGILNPPAANNKNLQTSLLPNLIKNVVSNVKNYSSFKIFELARVFLPLNKDEQGNKDLPDQPKRLAGAVVASVSLDVFLEVKGILQGLFNYLNIAGVKFVFPDDKSIVYETDRCLAITLGDIKIGYFGELKSVTRSKFDFKDKAVCFFELSISELFSAVSNKKVYQPLLLHPIVLRDMAVVVASNIKWQDIKKEVLKASKFVKDIELFDIYTGDKVPAGNKSVAFSISLAADRTFESTEVDKEIEKIMRRIEVKFKGKLRDF